jgi:hypothetical protein
MICGVCCGVYALFIVTRGSDGADFSPILT